MGAYSGPEISNDGLVFHFDMSNTDKSYIGPNFQNKIYKKESTPYGSPAGISSDRSTEIVDIPEIGKTTVLTHNFYNDYPAVSSNCCPNLFRYSENNAIQRINLSPSTLYTYAIVYRVESGYTHPNFMYRYEYNSSGSMIKEGGVHNNTNRVHLGDGWYWAWNTFTTQATTAYIGFSGFFYYRYSTVLDKVQLAKIFMTEGNFTQVHPRHWPEVNTTRDSTSAIEDLTKKNLISVSNLSYTSEGFEFDGTDDYFNIQSVDIPSGVNDFTCEGWIYPGNQNSKFITPYANGIDNWISYDATNQRLEVYYTEDADINNAIVQTSASSVPVNQWTHFSVSINDRTIKIWLNGELKVDFTEPDHPIASWRADWRVGQRGNNTGWFLGKLSEIKIYNRTLSSQEVKNNYLATKSRYGL